MIDDIHIKTPQGWVRPSHVRKDGKWVPYKPSPAVQEAMRRPRAVVPAPTRAPVGAVIAFVVGHAAVGLVCLSIVSGLVVMLGSLR